MASTCRTIGTKYKRALEKLKLIKRFCSVNSFCDQPSLFQVYMLRWQTCGKENAWKYQNKVGVKYQKAEFRWFRICALAESADGCMKWDTGGGSIIFRSLNLEFTFQWGARVGSVMYTRVHILFNILPQFLKCQFLSF